MPTAAHKTAVSLLPQDRQEWLLRMAETEGLSVASMMRYHRATVEADKPEKQETAKADGPGSPPRAKRNRTTNGRLSSPASDTTESALEPVVEPRAAVTPVEPSGVGKVVRLDLAASLIADIGRELAAYAADCPHDDQRPEARRLRDLWRSQSGPVRLSIEDWKGRQFDRVRRPGVVGLLLARANGRPSWAWSLAIRILEAVNMEAV